MKKIKMNIWALMASVGIMPTYDGSIEARLERYNKRKRRANAPHTENKAAARRLRQAARAAK